MYEQELGFTSTKALDVLIAYSTPAGALVYDPQLSHSVTRINTTVYTQLHCSPTGLSHSHMFAATVEHGWTASASWSSAGAAVLQKVFSLSLSAATFFSLPHLLLL